MKVLLSAHACNPESTSECIVGWRCLLAVASKHDVWLMTSERNRDALTRAREMGYLKDNVHINFVGRAFTRSKRPMIAKLKEWPYFYKYLNGARTVAERLHQLIGFDLVHHATFATWRAPLPFHSLGIPFVIGPIGGGETFNMQYAKYLSWQARIFELCRNYSTAIANINPSVGSTFRNASIVLSANTETSNIIQRYIHDKNRILNLLVTSFSEDAIKQYPSIYSKEWNGPLRLVGGGTCEGRKGILIALEALKHVKSQGVKYHYTFAGSGPEARYLIKKRNAMGLTSQVDILPSMSRADYLKHLASAHIYLLPSLRDNSPVALMEAMLSGCVPVVAKCNGPAVIVNENCGYSCDIDNPENLIQNIANVICDLNNNREKLKVFGECASFRIVNDFNDTVYSNAIENAYQKAVVGYPIS